MHSARPASAAMCSICRSCIVRKGRHVFISIKASPRGNLTNSLNILVKASLTSDELRKCGSNYRQMAWKKRHPKTFKPLILIKCFQNMIFPSTLLFSYIQINLSRRKDKHIAKRCLLHLREIVQTSPLSLTIYDIGQWNRHDHICWRVGDQI